MYNFRFLLKWDEIVCLLHGVLSVLLANMLILSTNDTLKCLIMMVLNHEQGNLSEMLRFFLKWYETIHNEIEF